MKAVERKKLNDIQNRLFMMFEIIEVSRDALFFSKQLRPNQVGIVLDGAAKEAEKLLCEIAKLAEAKRN